jgi:hypothetical protein
MVNIFAKQGLDPIVASSVAECQQSMAQENVGLIFCARSLADGNYRDLEYRLGRVSGGDAAGRLRRHLGSLPSYRCGMGDLASAAQRTRTNQADHIRATGNASALPQGEVCKSARC